MNVFVLCTGRCGSKTFAMACRHITNYTSGHETRISSIGRERLRYPNNHIEVDNRLSWFLGRLDEKYGKDAMYVHLKRNPVETAKSFQRRIGSGIIGAYGKGIIMRKNAPPPMELCLDYVETVNANIALFLRDKPKTFTVNIENAKQDFALFMLASDAQGDVNAALAEWDVKYNQKK